MSDGTLAPAPKAGYSVPMHTPSTPESLIAEVRAALGVAGEIASAMPPTEEQLRRLALAVAKGNTALNEIAIKLLAPPADGLQPPDPG